ncbi:MAG: hypothetical protein K8T91_28215 [Planctomycetes bacterium]|nr:hypothetical protein [Planctomycetota bacterium]
MSPKKVPSSPASSAGLSGAMRLMWARGPLLFTLGVALCVLAFGTFWVWQAVGKRVLESPQYRLDPQQISINTPPEWISADDLRKESLRNASLDRSLSIMDEQLTERIALAFAAHPWVARVERVEKFHPAKVEVRLLYRKPVASVATGDDLWPVDATGVLLPRENLSRAALVKFPQIGGIEDRPAARPGNIWQDMRVRGGSRIAEALGDSWQELGLAEISPYNSTASQRQPASFKLVTRGGKQIDWGRQPLDDDPSEPAAAEKVKRLKSWVQQHGSLDGVALRPAARR